MTKLADQLREFLSHDSRLRGDRPHQQLIEGMASNVNQEGLDGIKIPATREATDPELLSLSNSYFERMRIQTDHIPVENYNPHLIYAPTDIKSRSVDRSELEKLKMSQPAASARRRFHGMTRDDV